MFSTRLGFDVPGGSHGIDVYVHGAAVDFEFTGADEAYTELMGLASESVDATVAALTEIGLYLEYRIKLYSPVDTGRLRSSWGHFTPQDLTDRADQHARVEAAMDAYYVGPDANNLEVSVGTRVVYAPIQNYKFGHYMVERGLQDTITEIPWIVDSYFEALSDRRGPPPF